MTGTFSTIIFEVSCRMVFGNVVKINIICKIMKYARQVRFCILQHY